MEMPKEGVYLVYFTASWCGPCRQMAPAYQDVMEELEERIKPLKIDVEEEPILASKYNVRGVPTLIFMKDGNEVNRHIGLMQKNKLKEFIIDNL